MGNSADRPSDSAGHVPWVESPSYDLNLSLPMRERIACVPAEALERGRALLDGVMAEIPAKAKPLADAFRLRTANRFHEEMTATARAVGRAWRAVMLANLSYDLMMSFIACSTVVLPTPNGPVIARNMDWWPEHLLARSSYLVRYVRGGKLVLANAGWPGAAGVVTGLSGAGFAVVLNAVMSAKDNRGLTGYPVLLHIRRVLEDAPDFDAAVDMLATQKLITCGLLTVAGAENHQRVVIERTASRSAIRKPNGDEPLVTTNDYRLMFKPRASSGAEIYESTCDRYDHLCEFFAGRKPDDQVTDEQLLYALTDPKVIQGITAQHVIMRPRTREIRLFVPRRLIEGP